MHFLGKVVAITGGGQGIGAGLVESFLKEGAQVCILDITVEKCEEFVETLKVNYGNSRVIFVKCDVTSADDIENAFVMAKNTFGKVDIFINNAGIINETNWEKSVAVNLKGQMLAAFAAMKHLGEKGHDDRGIIVNISSISALTFCLPMTPTYVAAKLGVLSFTKSLGQESYYKEHGVKVIGICPSKVKTSMGQIDLSVALRHVHRLRDYTQGKYSTAFSVEEFAEEAIQQILKLENGQCVLLSKDEEPMIVDLPF